MAKPIAVVVIPTYNEADSIGKMIEYLFDKIFPKIKNWEMKVLICDDSSPDGTYKAIEKYQKKYKNLYLSLAKSKAGIGGAYVRGFKYAMDKLKADAVIEIDADFQHPPETIPVMLAEIDKGADYVMGSRNIKGGSIPKTWSFKRVFFSKIGGGLVARFVLFFPFKPFFQVTDPTTGLKASRVKGFVDKMDMDHLYSRQFGYKTEFLYQMVKLGAKIKEIPLQFGLRTTGESKITSQTAKDIFRTIFLLRWHDPFTQKFLKFGTVGFIGYLVNAIGLAVVFNLTQTEWLAWLVSTEIAIISNFILAFGLSILVAVVYLLLLIFILTFFKHGVLIHLADLTLKTAPPPLSKLFKINLVLIGTIAAAFLLFFILSLILFQREFAFLLSWVFIGLSLLLFYPYYNLAHSLFTHKKYSLKKTIRYLGQWKFWICPYLFLIVVLASYFLLFWLVSLMLGTSVYAYYSLYTTTFATLLFVLLYGIIFFNRVYFVLLTNKFK